MMYLISHLRWPSNRTGFRGLSKSKIPFFLEPNQGGPRSPIGHKQTKWLKMEEKGSNILRVYLNMEWPLLWGSLTALYYLSKTLNHFLRMSFKWFNTISNITQLDWLHNFYQFLCNFFFFFIQSNSETYSKFWQTTHMKWVTFNPS